MPTQLTIADQLVALQGDELAATAADSAGVRLPGQTFVIARPDPDAPASDPRSRCVYYAGCDHHGHPRWTPAYRNAALATRGRYHQLRPMFDRLTYFRVTPSLWPPTAPPPSLRM